MHNGGIWLESKVGEHGVLTWRGRDAGDDPFTDDCDCEAATPNFRESVRWRGGKGTCSKEISIEESLMADEGKKSIELVEVDV